MINPSSFQTCIGGLVGFRPSLDASMPVLESDIQASSSGLYVNDQHALVTIENIYNTIVNTGIITLPTAWSNTEPYIVGSKVLAGGIIYTALQANTGHAVTEILYWERNGSPLNIYLKEKLNQAAIKLANAVYLQKNLNQTAKSILPDCMLYSGNGNLRKSIAKSGRFVGFKINIKGMDLGAIIRKIGLQFNEIQEDLAIYLYSSESSDPIKVWESISTTAAYTFQWKTLAEQVMSFLSDTTAPGTEFYLGYYEDDITGNAINNEYSFTTNFCGPCNPLNYRLRQGWHQYIGIQPFLVLADNLNEDRTMWNTEDVQLTDGINFGLNLLVSVFCDTTDFFCRNKSGLANAIALQCAVSIIEDMGYSARDNQQSLKLQQLANYALQPKENNGKGLYDSLKDAITGVNFNFSGSNEKCLPCADIFNNTVKVSSVY